MRPLLQPRPEDQAYLRRLGWTIAIALVLLVLWRSSDLLLLGFGSVLGAILFRSAGRLVERLGIRNPNVALILGITLVLTASGLTVFLGARQFGGQIAGMLSDVPRTIARIEAGLATTEVGKAFVEATHAAIDPGAFASRTGDLALAGGKFLVNLIIVIIGAIFIAVSPRPYLKGLILLATPGARPAMERALGEVSAALRLWLRMKLIAMLAMTVLFSASFWLAGLQSWAALGLLGGLSEFVPYVGPTVAMVPVIGLAALQGGHTVWRTLLALLLTRGVEAIVLTPWLNRSVIAIPPAVTLFVILGVGAVFGLYAAFFSGALLVVGFVLVREIYLRDALGEDIEGVPEQART